MATTNNILPAPFLALTSSAPDHLKKTGRPLVTVSYAQSLDGSIAARQGQALSLSSPEAFRLTHRIRSLHEGILVGIGTILADDPRLNVRLVTGETPQPIILDTHLRFPNHAKALSGTKLPWIFTGGLDDGAAHKAYLLEESGARIFSVSRNSNGCVSLNDVLLRLGELGISSLMVEGGGQIIQQFIKARLVDQVLITIAPLMVGGYKAVGDLVTNGMSDKETGKHRSQFPEIREFQVCQLENDILFWGRMTSMEPRPEE